MEFSLNRWRASRIWGMTRSAVSIAAFVWLFTGHIAQATVVPSESMKPAILIGDHFFIDKLAFPANYPEMLRRFLPARTINRGDIVAFWPPDSHEVRLVKRVIGLPGETLETRGRDVYINGKKLNEPYTVHIDPRVYPRESWVPEELQIRDNFGPVTIPENHFFMMGDNRDNSRDSRYFGVVGREDLVGKPIGFVYWSYDSDSYYPVGWTLRDWADHYASVATHFFSKTRWSRIGTVLQ